MVSNDVLARLFAELVDGAETAGGAYVLNSGDVGLLASLEKLSHADASRSIRGGATIAAHVQHLRFGLSLLNRAAAEGGDPYSDPLWDEAWKVASVTAEEWSEIRTGFRAEAHRWLAKLKSSGEVTALQPPGIVASVAHVAYHFGAIRQIATAARGPTKGIFIPDR